MSRRIEDPKRDEVAHFRAINDFWQAEANRSFEREKKAKDELARLQPDWAKATIRQLQARERQHQQVINVQKGQIERLKAIAQSATARREEYEKTGVADPAEIAAVKADLWLTRLGAALNYLFIDAGCGMGFFTVRYDPSLPEGEMGRIDYAAKPCMAVTINAKLRGDPWETVDTLLHQLIRVAMEGHHDKFVQCANSIGLTGPGHSMSRSLREWVENMLPSLGPCP